MTRGRAFSVTHHCTVGLAQTTRVAKLEIIAKRLDLAQPAQKVCEPGSTQLPIWSRSQFLRPEGALFTSTCAPEPAPMMSAV